MFLVALYRIQERFESARFVKTEKRELMKASGGVSMPVDWVHFLAPYYKTRPAWSRDFNRRAALTVTLKLLTKIMKTYEIKNRNPKPVDRVITKQGLKLYRFTLTTSVQNKTS